MEDRDLDPATAAYFEPPSESDVEVDGILEVGEDEEFTVLSERMGATEDRLEAMTRLAVRRWEKVIELKGLLSRCGPFVDARDGREWRRAGELDPELGREIVKSLNRPTDVGDLLVRLGLDGETSEIEVTE